MALFGPTVRIPKLFYDDHMDRLGGEQALWEVTHRTHNTVTVRISDVADSSVNFISPQFNVSPLEVWMLVGAGGVVLHTDPVIGERGPCAGVVHVGHHDLDGLEKGLADRWGPDGYWKGRELPQDLVDLWERGTTPALSHSQQVRALRR